MVRRREEAKDGRRMTFEPFRIKSVEPMRASSPAERAEALRAAGCDLFRVPAELVLIDLLTDSGTSAMSGAQWAAMMGASDAYAASKSHARLTETVERITGFRNVIPLHQGRAAERLLAEVMIGGCEDASVANGSADELHRWVVPNNAHFDTTRRAIEGCGSEAVNLLPEPGASFAEPAPFKGNMDVRRLTELLAERGDDVPFVMVTVTCNSNGGQPVSLENLRAVRRVCERFGKSLILDACRYAENAVLIRKREPGQTGRSVREIVREMFDLADGATMSARKDCLSNTGGMLLLRSDVLHRAAARRCVHTEGFTASYGPLAGRDLEAIAVGMEESLDERYLEQRVNSIAGLGRRLALAGVPVLQPTGGHAVYVDGRAFLPHVSSGRHQPRPTPGLGGPTESVAPPASPSAAHTLACALYEQSGVRATRIGSVVRNAREARPVELLRLAIPRRVYTQSHLDYVADAVIQLKARAHEIRAYPSPSSTVGPERGGWSPVVETKGSAASILDNEVVGSSAPTTRRRRYGRI